MELVPGHKQLVGFRAGGVLDKDAILLGGQDDGVRREDLCLEREEPADIRRA